MSPRKKSHPELLRLYQPDWRKWGPYLSERQWGTVREDYSADGAAWTYLPHDAARSTAYRWGEDGLMGFSDDKQLLCFSLALWNEKDPILKERLFGLSGPEGNHGEDVKELYYYLDSTPTHSYVKMLYKYPHAAYPYQQLVDVNQRRAKTEREFELIDAGLFDENRYFDVFIEYAKESHDDIVIKVSAFNHGPEEAPLHIIPQLWFRNTWNWAKTETSAVHQRPAIVLENPGCLKVTHDDLGEHFFYFAEIPGEQPPEALFCDNETNKDRFGNARNSSEFFKDGLHEFIVHKNVAAVSHTPGGTKAGVHYSFMIPPQGSKEVLFRFTTERVKEPLETADIAVGLRKRECETFYEQVQENVTNEDERRIQRQAFAGMLCSKQFYHYDVRAWLQGDTGQPVPPEIRKRGRNHEWPHLLNEDIISMPDKWEYPWYAAWDLAFHCVPLALVDPAFAKQQLLLLVRERYMHPNGQLPAYEWSFSDVNPPVHAWAAWKVYQIDKQKRGEQKPDYDFLERILHKLLLNFTWWVNKKDSDGKNIFQGGFLGLDNIGVFDRSAPLPQGGHMEQADATAWMGMYCLNLMRIAAELSTERPAYQDLAYKFFEHFLYIAEAMVNIGGKEASLWDEEDKFFYDMLHNDDGRYQPLRLRSIVGLIPIFAVEVLEPELLMNLPDFRKRLEEFLFRRPDLANLVSRWSDPGKGEIRLLSLLRGHRMKCLLRRMLDETEFLSTYGIRAMSKFYEANPYEIELCGYKHTVKYQPAESDSSMFGGNSNWRGPIWFPVNYLLVDSLRKFHLYYGDDFKVECPVNSKNFLSLSQIADELSARLCKLFTRDASGRRPMFGELEKFHEDKHFKDYILFYEYFHGDNGRGVGASHQTGWTGLVANLIQEKWDSAS